jgi:hypothetical protein
VVVGKILESKDPHYGYNAQTNTFEDLVKAGVIDPTKVTRTALQNAASIAGLMLTTEAMVSEIPEAKSGAPRAADTAAAWKACTRTAKNRSGKNRLATTAGFVERRGPFCFPREKVDQDVILSFESRCALRVSQCETHFCNSRLATW